MVKRLVMLVFVLIVLAPAVMALDCQYIDKVYKTETKDVFYEDGNRLNYTLIELTNFNGPTFDRWYGNTGDANFQVNNNHPLREVALRVFVTSEGTLQHRNLSIGPLGYKVVYLPYPANYVTKSIRYEFLDESFEMKSEQIKTLINTTCRLCNEKPCLNDGVSCTAAVECGGGNCVRGICSNTKACFNGDCRCSSDEVQCGDNRTCVKKNVVPIDVAPDCNKPQECTTGYISTFTGVCAKSPSQIQEEERQRADKKAAEEKLILEQERERADKKAAEERLLQEKERERAEKAVADEKQRMVEEALRKEKNARFWFYGVSVLVVLVAGGIAYYQYLIYLREQEWIAAEEARRKEEIQHEEARAAAEEERRKTEHKNKIEIEKAKTVAEEARQKTLQKEMDFLLKQVETQERTLHNLQRDIKMIEKQKHIAYDEIKQLEKLKSRKARVIAELATQRGDLDRLQQEAREVHRLWEEAKTPFPDPQVGGMLVVKNPFMGGYKCFYEEFLSLDDEKYKKKLVHVWVWKKAHGRWPRPGYEVHHIDGNKYNNAPENLEELTKEEHSQKHRLA